MFKKLLTTMLVLALVVTAGSAIAGDASYKVYGKLHTSLNMLNNGDNSQLGASSNSSLFGVKGANELNEDFTLIWQFENDLMMADGSGTVLGTRNTYIGFKHATAGQIRVGKHDTPFKVLGRKVDLFSDQIGDARTLTARGPAHSYASVMSMSPSEYRFTTWDNRLGDVVAWVSPDWSGFGLFLAHMLDQGDRLSTSSDDYSAMTAFSGMASYSKDEIFVGAAYEALSEGFAPYYTASGATSRTFGDAASAIRLAGKYTAEKFVVSGLYQAVSAQALDTSGATPAFEDIKSNVVGFSAQYLAAPKWAIKGTYYTCNEYTDGEDDAATTEMDEGDWTSTMIAIGVDHLVNKHVKVYAQWATVSNGEMTTTALGSNSGFGASVSGSEIMEGTPPVGTGTYENPSGISMGAVVSW